MFITATAPNPLVVDLISKATGAQISISWGMWATAMLLPALVALVLMPIILYYLYPPEQHRPRRRHRASGDARDCWQL